jgi:putative spermidine/putrescine transport system ATP-binding protein
MASVPLELEEISKSFGELQAVKPLSLKVNPGEMLALLGPSGCGKTTTLRIIAGFEPPDTGRVLIAGRDVTDLPPNKRALGMVFQSYGLFPHMSVADNVAFGLKMRGIGRAARDERVRAMLSIVRLSGFEGRTVHQLSGGQQQRVALARSLVTDPTLLLLDEPLGALDKNLRERMQFELRQLQRRIGITSILVTHDQEEALTMSDRVAVMEHGDIVQVGPPAEVYERPKTRFVSEFLGTSNFLTGKVLGGVAAGEWEIAFQEAGAGRIATPAELVPGQTVSIAVRPENLRFAPTGAKGLAAKIRDVVFRGNYYAYEVKLQGHADPLFVYTQAKAQLPSDGEVTLDWSSDKAIFISGGAP